MGDIITNAQSIFWGYKNIIGLLKRDSPDIIMESTPEILSRLKFLGQIQKGDKISVRNMIFQPDGWMTRFQRYIVSPDNRNNTLKFVREVIARSFEILSHNITSDKESEIYQCRLIIKDLSQSKQGLLNLMSTYSDDVKFECDIKVLLQMIGARLSEVRKTHTSLFEPDPLEESTAEPKEQPNKL